MDEGGGLECVAGVFGLKKLGGLCAELVVDEGEEAIGGGGITGACGGQDCGDIVCGRVGHGLCVAENGGSGGILAGSGVNCCGKGVGRQAKWLEAHVVLGLRTLFSAQFG